MSDPRRILDGDADRVEGALLRSALGDAPSDESRKRAAAALGIALVPPAGPHQAPGPEANAAPGANPSAGSTASGVASGAGSAASGTGPGAGSAVAAAAGKVAGAPLIAGVTTVAAIKSGGVVAVLGAAAIALAATAAAVIGVATTRNVRDDTAQGAREPRGPREDARLAAAVERPVPEAEAPAGGAATVSRVPPRSLVPHARERGFEASDVRSSARVDRERKSSPPAVRRTPEEEGVQGPAVEGSAVPPSDEGVAPARVPDKVEKSPSGAGVASLDEEVALLDEARALLAAHDPEGALRALDAHARRFSLGMLVQEADAVAIDATLEKGDRRGAIKRAERFLARYPNSPLARRFLRLVEDAKPAAEDGSD